MAFGTTIHPDVQGITITASSNTIVFNGTSIDTEITNVSNTNKSIDVYLNDLTEPFGLAQNASIRLSSHITDMTFAATDGTSTGLEVLVVASVVR